MVTKELLDYINRSKQNGQSVEEIRNSLIIAGWNSADISEALGETTPTNAPTIPTAPTATPATMISTMQQAMASATPAVTTKENSGLLKKVIIGVVAFLIVSIGAAGAYYYFFAEKPPQDPLTAMLNAWNNVKTYEFALNNTSDFQVNASDLQNNIPIALMQTGVQPSQKASSKYSFKISADGVVDVSNKKSSDNITIEASLMDDALKFSLGGEIVYANDTLYFHLTKMPFPISAPSDSWIKLDQSKLESLQESTTQIKEIESKKTEIMQKITDSYLQNKFLTFQNPRSEQFEGEKVYTYDVNFDKNVFISFLQTIEKIIIANTSQSTTASNNDEIKKQLGSVQFENGILRIGANDNLPRSFSMKTSTKDGNSSNFSLILKNYNKDVSIKIPAKTIDFEEAVGMILGGALSLPSNSLNTAREKSRDARRIADIKQIELALVIYADNKGYYPTTLSALTGKNCSGGIACIPAIPKPPEGTKQTSYKYFPFKSDNGKNSQACTSNCNSYHLGTVLEDSTSAQLKAGADADFNSLKIGGFNGASSDCANGTGKEQCFDLTGF